MRRDAKKSLSLCAFLGIYGHDAQRSPEIRESLMTKMHSDLGMV